MSEVVERVARIVHEFGPCEMSWDEVLAAKEWKYQSYHLDSAREAAREIIEAMREPTEDMLRALNCAGCDDEECKHDGWQAAIDKALE